MALIVAAYALALSLRAASSPQDASWLLMLHRSVGVTILLLTVIRVRVRLRTRLPPWPVDLTHWQRRAARISELALYLVLIVQPALGIAGSMLRGSIVLFGVPVPSLVPPDRPLGRDVMGMHFVVAALLVALIALHVGAALHHHFVRRDDVLARMLPMMRKWRR